MTDFLVFSFLEAQMEHAGMIVLARSHPRGISIMSVS